MTALAREIVQVMRAPLSQLAMLRQRPALQIAGR
jgi:hypothetical protein